MAIFNSYVSLPEGNFPFRSWKSPFPDEAMEDFSLGDRRPCRLDLGAAWKVMGVLWWFSPRENVEKWDFCGISPRKNLDVWPISGGQIDRKWISAAETWKHIWRRIGDDSFLHCWLPIGCFVKTTVLYHFPDQAMSMWWTWVVPPSTPPFCDPNICPRNSKPV
jgi:hypothetical protein